MKIKKALVALTIPVIAVLTMASSCDNSPAPKQSAQGQGQQQTEDAFSQQSAAVPYPVSALTDSTERRNLRERLLRFNQPTRIGYVYLLTITGQPIGYYAIEGKVSSPDSQMTTQQLIYRYCTDCSGGGVAVTVPAPGDDGSYGPNEPGIFFFTTEGALVETNQNYLYSDQPIPAFINLPKLNGRGTVADLSQRK